jgi:tRNA (guanosine-2'-O-)-methyltransferase
MTGPSEANRVMSDLLESSGSVAKTLVHRGRILDPARVIESLAPLISEDRRTRINNIISSRTCHVIPTIEGVTNTGNVSAVMRTAEALGFQRFDVVTGNQSFKHSRRTTQGADKWLDVRTFRDPSTWAEQIREEGYRIAVTHLSQDSILLENVDFTRKTAVVFGNEVSGASKEMVDEADLICRIQTVGFVQSFNISVAAAITLHHARSIIRDRSAKVVHLSPAEVLRLRAACYMRSVAHSSRILDRLFPEEDPF